MVAASLLTGCSVALSGVVGFVGLIVPHLVRIMLGATHRKVLAGSFLLGGAFLVFADGLARVLIRPLEIPVGVITGFFGGLFFLSLLLGQRGRRVW
ncbi:MAG TPA: iron chelate uptake ABC transporter family permease subunit [bacterium]|nr:iron chelate uptake ABC transporter family permease subunit [bacterium]